MYLYLQRNVNPNTFVLAFRAKNHILNTLMLNLRTAGVEYVKEKLERFVRTFIKCLLQLCSRIYESGNEESENKS